MKRRGAPVTRGSKEREGDFVCPICPWERDPGFPGSQGEGGQFLSRHWEECLLRAAVLRELLATISI